MCGPRVNAFEKRDCVVDNARIRCGWRHQNFYRASRAAGGLDESSSTGFHVGRRGTGGRDARGGRFGVSSRVSTRTVTDYSVAVLAQQSFTYDGRTDEKVEVAFVSGATARRVDKQKPSAARDLSFKATPAG